MHFKIKNLIAVPSSIPPTLQSSFHDLLAECEDCSRQTESLERALEVLAGFTDITSLLAVTCLTILLRYDQFRFPPDGQRRGKGINIWPDVI